jgi:hypothetical protein
MNRFFNKTPAGGTALPWMTPALFGKLQSEIDAACLEMERMKIKKPTPELVGRMTSRIYDNVHKEYPELDKYARIYDKGLHASANQPVSMYGVEIQEGGFFAGLIALLLLAGFFGRRRFRRRF